MRTINVYTYDELVPEAQSKARDWYRGLGHDYHWDNEAMHSLRAFAEHFGTHLADYEIDWTNSTCRSYVKFGQIDAYPTPDQIAGLSSAGMNCRWTGYCADADLAGGALQEYRANEAALTTDVMQAGVRAWLKAVWADAKYQDSDEAVGEMLEANNYEFTEDGRPL